MAGSNFLQIVKPHYLYFPSVGRFVFCGIKGASERVLAKNPNDDRRGGIRKGGVRPLHKLGEVEQNRRLDLIFARSAAVLTRTDRAACRQPGCQRENGDFPDDENPVYAHNGSFASRPSDYIHWVKHPFLCCTKKDTLS